MDQARAWLRSASSVVVLTGAGISAESGMATFRGPGGIWKQFRSEDLATPEAFTRDPKLVWEWYDWRRQKHAAAKPNAGHAALVALERTKERFTLVTQNVDSLHEQAGSRDVIHLHGEIWMTRCTVCGREQRDERTPLPEIPPRCERCQGLLRPGVVWFGEPLPRPAWLRAEQAARTAEVLLVVGTSAVVYPAAALVPLAKACGARVIECNIEETPFSAELDRSFRGRAGELLPLLIG